MKIFCLQNIKIDDYDDDDYDDDDNNNNNNNNNYRINNKNMNWNNNVNENINKNNNNDKLNSSEACGVSSRHVEVLMAYHSYIIFLLRGI